VWQAEALLTHLLKSLKIETDCVHFSKTFVLALDAGMFASVNLYLHFEWITPLQWTVFQGRLGLRPVSYISCLQKHVFIALLVLTGYSIQFARLSSVAL